MMGTAAFAAGGRKEFKYTVASGANVTLVNQFGDITVRPSNTNQLIIAGTTHSDKVEIDSDQNGNRIEARSHFLQKADDKEGRVDYEVSLPAGMNLSVQAATGVIEASRVSGELTLKADSASINV